MYEYVNIKLVGIIIKGVAQFRPELLSKCDVFNKIPKNTDKVHVSIKREILDTILEEGGAQLILRLATALESELTTSPLLFFLLNSPSPADLVRKLEQYDKYFHSSRQIKLTREGDKQLIIDHIDHHGSDISASEDLFVSGLVTFLLEKLGCQNLSIQWKQINDPKILNYLDDENTKALPISEHCRWIYRWDSFKVINTIPGLDSFLLNNVNPISISEGSSLSSAITKIILQDLHRKWELSELASQLHMSKRTLQRRLKEEGLIFTKLINTIRIEQSLEMLKNSEHSLAEIGYLLGFSDSSHFSREFKKAKGVTPLMFRQQANQIVRSNTLTAS